MTTLDSVLDAIFDGRRPEFYAEFEGWARASRRFRAFAVEHQTKIRAKLRDARDADGLIDLRAELEAAARLLRDDRFALEYERYASLKQRGPDFTVTFRTRIPFNVEVRRIRGAEWEYGSPAARSGKLIAVLCDKVGQMPGGIVNLLWLSGDRDLPESDLATAMLTLRQLAERKSEDDFTRRGFRSAADFLRQFRHLSALVVRQPAGATVMPNPLARHAVPLDIARAIERLPDR